MGLAEIKARLAHIAGIDRLTVQQNPDGSETYRIGSQSVDVSAGNAGVRGRIKAIATGLAVNAASLEIDQVDAPVAIISDPVTTQVIVHREITGRKPMKLQGLASKMALLRHNLEAEAEKLGNRVDGAANKSTETFAKSHKFLDTTDKDLADVEKFIADLDAATNGAPPIEEGQ